MCNSWKRHVGCKLLNDHHVSNISSLIGCIPVRYFINSFIILFWVHSLLQSVGGFTACGWQAAECSIFIELYDLLIVSSVCAGLKIKSKQSAACSRRDLAKILSTLHLSTVTCTSGEVISEFSTKSFLITPQPLKMQDLV